MRRLLFVFLLGGLICSCESSTPIDSNASDEDLYVPESAVNKDSLARIERIDSIIESNLHSLNLVKLQSIDSTILIDLKYATTDNFMGKQLYDSLNTVYLREDVAIRLKKCQQLLDSIRPGYRLLVYDGVRPLGVQQEMWDALDTIPANERGKFVSNPKLGSVHNFGAAIDVTICDTSFAPLDMGAGYDDFREIAFPSMEQKFLKSGELSKNQVKNRKLLRKVMRFGRFYNIPSEWWHFNAYSRVYCDSLFVPLLFESGNK